MGRDPSGKRKGDLGRVAGGFVALPWQVLDCPAYLALRHADKALLIEIARQFVRDNNGRLLASRAHLAGRGWKSAGLISQSIKNLLSAGLIHQTVRGHRPNKASWFAVTWRLLDPHPGYDPGAAATFERSSYLRATPAPMPRRKPPQRRPIQNAGLSPMAGKAEPPIAPMVGTEARPAGPMVGAVTPGSVARPVPYTGHHLELPSAGTARKPKAKTATHQPEARARADNSIVERVREDELDPALFDPTTGEHVQASPKARRPARKAAEAWVAASLQQQASSASKTKTEAMNRNSSP